MLNSLTKEIITAVDRILVEDCISPNALKNNLLALTDGSSLEVARTVHNSTEIFLTVSILLESSLLRFLPY